MLPAGTYTAKAVETRNGKIDSTGSDFVSVLFRITDGQFKGSEVVWKGFLTEKAMEDTKLRLEWMGWTGEIEGKVWVGVGTKDVSIQVQHRGYTDNKGASKTSVEVKWVNRVGDGPRGGKELDGEQMKDLALRIGAKIKGVTPPDDNPF